MATGARDKKIRIFEVKTGKLIITLAGHDNWVTDLWFHPNGKYLISSADDKSIRIWDLVLGRCYRKIYNAHDHFVSCFDMKGKIAASGSVDTTVKLWQARWEIQGKLPPNLEFYVFWMINNQYSLSNINT